MFFAEAQIRVHLYGQPTDMRKSYDGLQALARHAMGRDPLDGALYIFLNRRGSQIKSLYFDRGVERRFGQESRVLSRLPITGDPASFPIGSATATFVSLPIEQISGQSWRSLSL